MITGLPDYTLCFACKKFIDKKPHPEPEIQYKVVGIALGGGKRVKERYIIFHDDCWKDLAGEEFCFEDLYESKS